ncbi:hypothetical protein ACP275_06G088300 [Erythranthe tilingii]
MDTRERSIRVLMLPWLAHGHISPFLELAKSLSTRNFVSYISSSPVNLASIRETLSPKHSISIKLVDLHIPATADLPPHRHTTNGLPPHLMPSLKRTLDKARPAFSTLLKTLKPDLVLYDFLQPWAPEEAALQNIPAVLFFTTGAATSSLLLYYWFREPGSEYTYPFPGIYFRENESETYRRMIHSAGGETNDDDRVRDCVKRSSDVVLIKTFGDLEQKYVDYLSQLCRKKFVPAGHLVNQDINNIKNHEKNDFLIEWLNEKERRSTVFASFGTEYFLSENEAEEIACGLEMSGVNFIWVVRFPAGAGEGIIKIEEKLPGGFLERVGGRGVVVEGWAPQRRILSHPSVGGFLSHCGWSSVMEGVYSGVPIVAAPMHLDQPLNARLVEEAGLGEEVVRSGEGRLDREEVARVVRKVVVERSGEELRRRVVEFGERMREKVKEEEIDGVVEEMVRLCSRGGERVNDNLERESSMARLKELMIVNSSSSGGAKEC